MVVWQGWGLRAPGEATSAAARKRTFAVMEGSYHATGGSRRSRCSERPPHGLDELPQVRACLVGSRTASLLWETCANPLHRLHRIPRQSKRMLEDVVPDACRVVDLILGLVDRCYPSFSGRVTLPNP